MNTVYTYIFDRQTSSVAAEALNNKEAVEAIKESYKREFGKELEKDYFVMYLDHEIPTDEWDGIYPAIWAPYVK